MSATEQAAALAPGDQVRWRALEIAALAGHPDVLQMLDPSGKYTDRAARRGPLQRSRMWWVPIGLLMVLVIFAPVFGFATLVGDRFGRSRPDPDVVVPIAGWFFAASAVLSLLSIAAWLWSGRPRDGLFTYQGGIALVLGALSAVNAAARGSHAGTPHWPIWTGIIALAAGLGGILVLAVRFASQEGVVLGRPRRDVGPLARVRTAISEFDPVQQQAIASDIQSAITDLETRGIIRPAIAQRARAAELGLLSVRMNEPRATGAKIG